MGYQPGTNVVMCVFRTPGDANDFLRSAYAYPPSPEWTITVAQVAPRDEDTKAMSGWFSWPKFSEWQSTDNCGYGAAVNGAVSLLHEPYDTLAIFNADVVMAPGVFDACRNALWSNDEWGILGPRQVNAKNQLVAAGIFGPQTAPAHRGWLEHDNGQYSDVRDDSVYVAGSAMWIKRVVWDELTECPIWKEFTGGAPGALLEAHPIFYEESAMALHARAHGFASVYFGPAVITHKLSQSIKANKVNATSIMKESRELFRSFCDAHSIEHE